MSTMMLKILEKNCFNDSQADAAYKLLKPYECEYSQDITGDACVGDKIVTIQAVFTGSFRSASFSHFEVIKGEIIKDSYGSDRGQHTFTLLLDNGSKKMIKGRNIYKYGLFAIPRDNSERQIALEEKHHRGNSSRNAQIKNALGY